MGDTAPTARVLVMNDTQAILDLIREVLEDDSRVSFSIETLDLARIKDLAPDLIVQDLRCSGRQENSWQFLMPAQLDPELARVPIILCTEATETVVDPAVAENPDRLGGRVLLLTLEAPQRSGEEVERDWAGNALRVSEARLATLLENLPDYAIFMVDPAGIVIEWTEGAQRVIGYAPEEVLGEHFSVFYTPEDQAARRPDWILAQATCTGRFEAEGWRVCKNGERFWGNEIATAVRNEAGNLVGFTKISRNLTERKQAEAALAESEERYRRIVEQAVDYAIFTADAQRRIETWPPGAQRVFGWSDAEAVGQPMDVTYTPEDQAAGVPVQEFTTAHSQGVAPNIRWHQRKDGSRVFIEGMTYPRFTDEGTFLGVFKVGQDATDRVLADEARHDDETRMREQLEAEVAAATLELRALSRRLLMVQEEERQNLARELHDEVGQMLTGLNFQLAVAADNGRVPALQEAQTTVQALTEQVRQLSMDLRPAVLDRYGVLAAVQWHLERYQQRCPVTVHLRHAGLEQRFAPEVEITAYRIVQEALTNVARHSGAGVATVQLLAEQGDLLIVVRDAGDGFDPAQASDTSGLGGMRERVHLVGGTLEIESTPGEGTTVTAVLSLFPG